MVRSVKNFIVPIFIPNQGCPYRCIFCDQKRITGEEEKISPKKVKEIIEMAKESKKFKKKIEVAFYGGTFTSLPLSYMKELLNAVKPYIEQGIVKEIRVSTRPDSLDEEKLKIMKDYSVKTVELGAQSFDNNVLQLANRGHSAEDTINAFYLLKKWGFKVGIQLMPGLPGDNWNTFKNTVKKTIELMPNMVRLYPTVVIRGTRLEKLFKEGKYKPLSLKEAIDICLYALIEFEKKEIPVIRIGLMNSESLLKNIVAGPWHPAFGFLVKSKAFIKQHIIPILKRQDIKKAKIFIFPNLIPLLRGHKNEALKEIESETGVKILRVIPDESLIHEKIRIVSEEEDLFRP